MMILLAHRGGHLIQGRGVIRGFLLAQREAGVTEFVEVHLNKVLAVFGGTALLLLALLLVVPGLLSEMTSGLGDTVACV